MEGLNQLEVENVGDTEAAYSMVFLNKFSVSYPRLSAARSGRLDGLWTESGTSLVTGLGGSSYLLEVTGAEPVWLSGFTTSTSGVAFRAEAGRRYLAVQAAAVLLPELRAVRPTAWKKPLSPVDYVVVGPSDLLAAAEPLLALRRSQSLRVRAVPVEDIYAEFGYGEPGTHAIKAFVEHAYHHWLGVDELRRMVSKIIEYEAAEQPTEPGIVLVADNPDKGGDFEREADEIGALFSPSNPRRIYLRQTGASGARAGILESFDQGADLVSYHGHGGIHLWADENILNSSNVSSLSPQPRQPLVLTMNCLNGYFHFPYFDSLAEALLKAEGRGAVAAVAPSGLSLSASAQFTRRLSFESSSTAATSVSATPSSPLKGSTAKAEFSPSCSPSITCSAIRLSS